MLVWRDQLTVGVTMPEPLQYEFAGFLEDLAALIFAIADLFAALTGDGVRQN